MLTGKCETGLELENQDWFGQESSIDAKFGEMLMKTGTFV